MDVKSQAWEVTPADVNLLIKEGRTFVYNFVWSNYNAGDICRITDIDGRDVFNQRGNLELEEISVQPGNIPFLDMFVAQMDSGVLLIYIR
jgi:hypothetical protein